MAPAESTEVVYFHEFALLWKKNIALRSIFEALAPCWFCPSWLSCSLPACFVPLTLSHSKDSWLTFRLLQRNISCCQSTPLWYRQFQALHPLSTFDVTFPHPQGRIPPQNHKRGGQHTLTWNRAMKNLCNSYEISWPLAREHCQAGNARQPGASDATRALEECQFWKQR